MVTSAGRLVVVRLLRTDTQAGLQLYITHSAGVAEPIQLGRQKVARKSVDFQCHF